MADFDKSGIIEFFLIEAGEHLQSLNKGLLSLEKDPGNSGRIDELFRAAHTLKGSAAMMGFQGISEVAHKAEDMLGQFRSGSIPIRKETLNFLFDSVDAINLLVEGVAGKQPEDRLLIDSIVQSYAEVVNSVQKPAAKQPAKPAAGAPAPSVPKTKSAPAPPVQKARDSLDDLWEANFNSPPEKPKVPAVAPPQKHKDDHDDAWERTFAVDLERAPGAVQPAPTQPQTPAQRSPESPAVKEQKPLPTGKTEETKKSTSPPVESVEEPAKPATGAAPDRTSDEAKVEQARPPQPPAADIRGSSRETVNVPASSTISEEIEEAKKAAMPERRGLGRRANDTTDVEKQFIRVNIERLDNLMNLVGEMVVNRNRLARQVDFIKSLREELAFSQARLLHEIKKFEEKYEYTLNYEALGGQTAAREQSHDFFELEFDRYDDFNLLSRKLTEITNDTNEIMVELAGFFDAFELDTARISTITTNLQGEITLARMVEMDKLYQMFQRPVRDLAQEENKQINMLVKGGDTKIDKTIFEIISDPLMHMIRNAVSHGIEQVETRTSAGKDPTGVILLNARHEGNNIVIEIEDDGSGMDPEVLRKAAIDKGFMNASEAAALPDHDVMSLIFHPGFSTAATVGKISGRGVGMDVVSTQLSKINGRIEIKTEKGVGTKFIIRLPLTLAIAQALIVKLGDQELAVPMTLVEETTRFSHQEIERAAGEEMVNVRGDLVRLYKLHDVMRAGKFPKKDDAYRHPTLILGMAEKRLALMVEDIIGREEIVVKTLGDYLKSVKLFSGATISGEGNVRLIINVNNLFGEDTALSAKATFTQTRASQAADLPKQKPRILVVDDSISIRKYVQRFLARTGYDVDVAPDGMEALNCMGKSRFDAVITDLEMPVMHGYDLLAEMKRQTPLAKIPVIVLTSRAGDKHRQKAIEMGAQDYLVKPFEEQEMLGALKKLLQGAALAGRA